MSVCEIEFAEPGRPVAPATADECLVIRPSAGWTPVDWRELYRGRELLAFLVWRDVKVRYKQAALGVVWAVLQPLSNMLIFSFIFGRFAGVPSDGVPYPLFVFAGLIPWSFFSNGLTQAGQSLVGQQHLLTKVYFPRLLVPTASVLAHLVDLTVSLLLYAAIFLYYGVAPGPGLLALPPLVVATTAVTLGFSYLMSALTVLFRDFRFILTFSVQILMYLTPIIYPLDLFPARLQYVLALNPMCGIVCGFRWAFLGIAPLPAVLLVSAASGALVLVAGLIVFRRSERIFSDLV